MRKKQEKNKLSSQIGSIIFIDKENTSKICPFPSCKEIVKYERNKFEDLKFRQLRFICNQCNFDTYLFKPKADWVKNYNPPVIFEDKKKFELFKDLDDPDKVAAYNIAIKITDSNKIGKWEIKKESKKNTFNKKKYSNKSKHQKYHQNKNRNI